ncbi:class I SAM-dependent methyltransferase [Kosmotoga olearia]|jgi:hypothetical protein|uniref:Methyltransferase n=1 Tax=Kosmotoga olearia (strain ATCC BAA-1733 / DSM 21960 / TBF 19.5.1) TaxID=521045 RepID=C5CD60_KOSOT|nr:class I SAM-dependent methyltransferase [Kosmotoga olearia]ACR79004.1 hypothetical protein Kole_0279 [Kosmotoga olearia TBF 19.5.1]
MTFIVTTSHKPDAKIAARAKDLAAKLGVPYVSRRRLKDYLKLKPVDFYYVLDRNGQLSISYDNQRFFFHPSMAKLRLKNFRDGQRDHLIESLELKGNELILDTTFGLGSEAILMAHFLTQGKVIGLEASPHIYRVVKHGLEHYPFQYQWMYDAVSKIILINADLKKFIRKVADGVYDIVYCDPMFEVPQYSSSSLNPLRPFAVYNPINEEDVLEMLRIAKKRVVLKTRNTDSLFDSFKTIKFDRISGGKSSGVLYGVIEKK